MYQKLLFLAGFYILFTAITVNATSLNIIKKNYQPITKKHNPTIITGLYMLPTINTAKIKEIKNIITFLAKNGFYSTNIFFNKVLSKNDKINLIKGKPVIEIYIPKNFESKYKNGLINKNILIINLKRNINKNTDKLINLFIKNGYNVRIETMVPVKKTDAYD